MLVRRSGRRNIINRRRMVVSTAGGSRLHSAQFSVCPGSPKGLHTKECKEYGSNGMEIPSIVEGRFLHEAILGPQLGLSGYSRENASTLPVPHGGSSTGPNERECCCPSSLRPAAIMRGTEGLGIHGFRLRGNRVYGSSPNGTQESPPQDRPR